MNLMNILQLEQPKQIVVLENWVYFLSIIKELKIRIHIFFVRQSK